MSDNGSHENGDGFDTDLAELGADAYDRITDFCEQLKEFAGSAKLPAVVIIAADVFGDESGAEFCAWTNIDPRILLSITSAGTKTLLEQAIANRGGQLPEENADEQEDGEAEPCL